MPLVDGHAHVVDPSFPFANGHGYRPLNSEVGTWCDYLRTLETHSVTHAVLVQPSGYGFDNSAMLDALQKAGDRWRGIAVVPPDASKRELSVLAESNVVGVRFNLLDFEPGVFGDPEMRRLLAHLRDLDLLAEVHATGFELAAAVETVVSSGVCCVVDHFGRPAPLRGAEESAFDALLGLVTTVDNVFVKLSAPFRVSAETEHYADLDPIVAGLLEAFTPDRCVWGSDWPFLGARPRPDYARLLTVLERWLPSTDDRERVTWHTPARLFGFV